MKRKKINKLIIVLISIFLILNIIAIKVTANINVQDLVTKIRNGEIDVENLSDTEIDNYIKAIDDDTTLRGMEYLKQEALEILENEKDSRGAAYDPFWGPGQDYNNYKPSSPVGNTQITSIAGNILGIVRNFGIVIALIALTIIGVKYMLGSIEQKAEYKKSMVPFVIGVIFLAASTTLVKIIYDVVTSAGL